LLSFLNINFKHCSDEELLLYIGKGKEKAFNELYKRYSKKMHFFFYQKLYYDAEKAADFVHDLFLKIIENPNQFDTNRKFKSWIYMVASNMCKNEYRRNELRGNKQVDFDFSQLQAITNQSRLTNDFDKSLFKQWLAIFLSEIDDNQSITFILRYEQEFSIKEIAEITESTEGTVKSRLFYTTRKLAEKLKVFELDLEEVYGK
jgi:RNA polymerase sigma-70 factor (ECF subfamily)